MGMFDSVYFKCPHCGKDTEVQSKAGDCTLDNFWQNRVPPQIAIDLEGDEESCRLCKESFKIVSLNKPTDVIMRAVKYRS